MKSKNINKLVNVGDKYYLGSGYYGNLTVYAVNKEGAFLSSTRLPEGVRAEQHFWSNDSLLDQDTEFYKSYCSRTNTAFKAEPKM